MAYDITTADIESRWRTLSTEESDLATTLISDAILKIDLARPQLAAAVTAGDVSLQLVAMAVVDIVVRVLTNPDRLRSTVIGADGSISVGYGLATEVDRARVAVGPGDLDAIDAALRLASAGPGIVTSRALVAYPESAPSMTTLPTP